MNCHDVEQFFDAFLDGELDGSLRLEFDAHRLRCRDCQQKLAMLETCAHILSSDSTPTPTLSDDFTDSVMAGIAEQAPPEPVARRVLHRIWPATALLPAAVLLLLAFIGPRFGSTPGNTTSEARSTTVTDLARIEGAMSSRVDLYQLIMGEAERIWAANHEIATEARSLPQYVMQMLPNDAEQSVLPSPFELLNILAPTPLAPEKRDAASAIDEYSL